MNKILLIFIFCFLKISSLRAADFYWRGGSGSFHNSNNWLVEGSPNNSNKVPGSDDRIIFDLSQSINVSFTSDIYTKEIIISSSSDITFASFNNAVIHTNRLFNSSQKVKLINSNGLIVKDKDNSSYPVKTSRINERNGANLIQPNSLTIVSITPRNVSCGGLCDGMIIVNSTTTCPGGVYTVDFIGDGGSTGVPTSVTHDNVPTGSNDTLKNLCKNGESFIIIFYECGDRNNPFTDGNSYSVAGPSPIVLFFSPATPTVSCPGSCDGTFTTINAAGGNTPTSAYTYSWSNGETTKIPVALCAGKNYVTTTDTKGCKKRDSVNVLSPNPINKTITPVNNTCSGACNGSVSVSASGGTGALTYSWYNSSGSLIGTGTSRNNLCAGTYALLIKDSKGCKDSTTFTIVDPIPISATSTSTDANCFGVCNGSFSLNISGGSPPYVVTSVPALTFNVSGSTATASAVCANNYVITVTDNNSCNRQFNDTINQPAQLIIIPTATPSVYCIGGSSSLTASNPNPNLTYSWSGGATTPTIGSPVTTSVTTTTTFTVVGTNPANGCTEDTTITVTVNPLPVITASPNTVSLCNGSPVTITASGLGIVSYSWSPSTGLSTTVGATVVASPSSATVYTVSGTNANGCIGTTTVSVNVNNPPNISISPSNSVSCNLAPVNFSASGMPTGTYNWTVGSGSVTGSPGTSVTVNATASTFVTVIAIDPNGCRDTATAAITVQPLPNITASATNTTICQGACTNLSAAGAGVGGTYSWVSGATTIGLTNPISVCPNVNTTYTVFGTNVNGCRNSRTITINVTPKPNVSVTLQSPVCSGTASTATASGAITYVWYDSGNNIISSTNTVTITPTTSTTITVIGIGASGCSDTVISNVLVNNNPTISGTASPSFICGGSSTVLTGSGAGVGGTYSWINGPSLVVSPNPVTVSPTSTTTYSLIGVDINGCSNSSSVTVTVNPPLNFSPNNPTICIGSSATITASGAVTYNWFTMAGVNIGSGPTITVSPTLTTSYVLQGTDINGCTGLDTVTVTVNPFLPLTVSNDTSLCSGNTLNLNASSSGIGVTYTWTGPSMIPVTGIGSTISVNPSVVGTYTYSVTATDINTCTNNDQVVVTVRPQPPVNTLNTQSVCIGSLVGLVASGALTYSWFTLPTSVFTGTGSPLNVSPIVSTTYSVVGTDINGCRASALTSVTVNSLPNASAGPDVAICFGGNTTLTGGGGITYSWLPTTGLSNPALSNPSASPTVTTNYSVYVTDINGCVDIDTVRVTVNSISVTAGAINRLICFGNSTGLTSSPSGGISYLWTTTASPTGLSNPNIQNPTATPSVNTIYTVQVTDANGCIGTDTALVNVDRVLGSTAITNPSGCTVADGSINLTVTSGIGPFSYSWSNGQTTEDILGLAAGNYTVIITDSRGCTGTLVASLSNFSSISLVGTIVNDVSTCSGADGSIFLNVTGASGTETYSWSNGASTPNISGLVSGTYNLTITDGSCIITQSFAINEPIPVSPFAGNDTSVCIGSTLTLNGNLNGGSNPVWVPGGAGSSITITANLPTSYTLTVIDINGCIASDVITVNANALPIVNAGPNLNVCQGSNVGLTASGALNYSWNGSGSLSSSTISNPIALNVADTMLFIVTGTDVNGCIDVDSVLLFTNPLLVSGVVTNASICGVQDGSIDVSVTGGFPSINYLWDFGSAITQDISGLGLGVYTVIVTDAAGCRDTTSFSVNEPSTFNLSETHLNATSCSGINNGSINLTVTGGSSPFVYSWTGPSGYTSAIEDISALAPGQYNVVVTDASGCGAALSVIILAPTPVVVIGGPDQNICSGNSVNLSATPPASGTYSWTGPNIVSGANSVSPLVSPTVTSQYTIRLTDLNGCITQDVVNVFVNNVSPSLASTNVTTCGGSNGSLVVSVSGGTPPYSYSWVPSAPGSGGFNNTGLTVGTYTVFVTDGLGCSGSASASISDPSNINFTGSTIVNPTTCSGNNGSISVTVGGGTAPFTYSWSFGGLSGPNPINLSAGNYTLTVTDAASCAASNTFNISDPVPSGIANGGPDLQVCSGSPIYFTADTANIITYSWISSSAILSGANTSSPSVSAIVTSNYTLFTTDNINCNDSDIVTLNVNASPLVSISSSSPVFCAGSTVTLSATGAVNYTWTPALGLSATSGSSVNATVSTSTTYTVTGTNSIGCSTTSTITVSPIPSLVLSKSVTNPSNCTANDGSVNITVTGGSGSYLYSWLPGNQVTQDLTNMGGGVYLLTVTDSLSGCSDTISAVLTEPSSLVVSGIVLDATACNDSGSIDLTISGGTAPYSVVWTSGQITQDIQGLSGNYAVVVTDANGCSSSRSFFIDEPTPLQVNAGPDQSICPGFSTSLSATGSLTYSWISGGPFVPGNTVASPFVNPVTTTNYIVEATDQNDCVSYDTVTVFVNSLLLSVFKSDVSICNGNDGAINLTVNGGNAPYSYSWSNGSLQEDLIGNLTVGNYQCIVTDNLSCKDTIVVSINEPSGFNITTVNNNPTNCGGNNGSIVLNIPGTVSVASVFVNGVLNGPLTNLTGGFYNIIVTDTNGCSSSVGVTLSNPIPTQIYAGADTAVCAGNSLQLDATTTGIVTYSWVGSGLSCVSCPNPSITPLISQSYTVFGTDSRGCISSDVLTVSPTNLSVIASGVNTTQCLLNDGILTSQVTGGTGAITFTWSGGPNINAQNQNNVPPGAYNLIVNDILSGCSASDTAVVLDPISYNVSLVSVNPSTCSGNNGSITAIINPAGIYTYTWNGVTDDSLFSGLAAGTYSLVVNDAIGCTFATSQNLTDPIPSKPYAGPDTSLCFGSSYTFNVSGGTFSTVSWSPSVGLSSSTTLNPTASPLITTVYTIASVDVNNCISSDTVQIVISQIIFNSSVVLNQTCGSSNASVKVNVTGGIPPFSHQWSNGAVTDSIGGLTAGIYIDSITDALGCVDTAMFILTDPVTFVTTYNAVNPSQCGIANGSIQITISNQLDPVVYLINGVNAGNPPFNNLPDGSYTISVTDASGCTEIRVINLTDPIPIQVDYADTLQVCAGSSQAVVLNNASQFSSATWSPSSSSLSCSNCLTPIITPVSAALYSVTATDVNGCNSNDAVRVLVNNLSATTNLTAPSCTGSDGQIALNLTGTAPYTVSWNTGFNGTTLTNLTSGTYVAYIGDAGGCSDTVTVNLSNVVTFNATITAVNPSSCNGSNGSISLALTGGTGPFTFSWTPNNQITQNITNLNAGVYSVSITDAANCVLILSDTLINPTPIPVNAGTGAKICLGSSFNLNAQIGFSNYSWTPNTNMLPSASIPNPTVSPTVLTVYTLTATDINNCVSSDTVIVDVNSFNLSFTKTNTSVCGAADGAIDVSVSGGTTPYSYDWSNGSISQDLNALTAGIYTLNITDGYGCKDSITVDIDDPVPFTFTQTITPISACGGTGGINVVVTGGTPPISFELNSNVVTMPVTNLAEGSYTLLIEDALGCTDALSFILSEPDTNYVFAGTDQNLCMGAGGAQLNASAPVLGNYTWSPVIGLSQSNISNPVLTVDTTITYVVTFTDNNNCTYRDSVLINSVKIFLTDTVINSASDCFSANGAINITVSGGTSPYTFSWTNGSSTEDISLVTAGAYTVTISESGVLNCSTSFTFDIPSVLPVTVNTSSDTTYCSGDSVLLSANGGGTYLWTEIGGALIGTSNPILVQPNIGLNTYIVTGSNGSCSDKDTINITLLPTPIADAGVNVETLEGNAELIGGNPTGPAGATYSWYPSDGVKDISSSNPSVNPSETTTYYVLVTNNLGCKAIDSVRVIVYPSIIVPSGFTPNGDGANEKWIIDFIYKYPESTVQVYNRWGQLLYESAPGYPEPWDGKYNGNDLPVGTYYYIIDVKQPLIKPYTGPITIMR